MGTWGTGILQNDSSADIYQSFRELYNEKKTSKIIISKLKSEFKEIEENEYTKNDFLFTIGLALWEICELDNKTLDEITTVIHSESDLKIWEELEADVITIKSRKKVLTEFLKKIQNPRDKPIRNKKEIIRPPIFKKGDCIVFKLENGSYGGAIVLEELGMPIYDIPSNKIILTRLNQKKIPTLDDFRESNLLIMNIGDYRDGLRVTLFCSGGFKKGFDEDFIKVGNIEIKGHLNELNGDKNIGLTYAWYNIQKDLNDQFNHEEKNSKPSKTIKTKRILEKSNKWKFWEK
jgi:hypothetical protein